MRDRMAEGRFGLRTSYANTDRVQPVVAAVNYVTAVQKYLKGNLVSGAALARRGALLDDIPGRAYPHRRPMRW